MILPKVRDPRFVTIRRGGTRTDADHLLTLWAAAAADLSLEAGRLECRWQREQLPEAIRKLVLDDQRLRNDICWSAFDCWMPGDC
ncbi:hypothetical protein [Actinoplanes sp. NBRC 103695]|uniref:hypothetical protein n=1 Tax=Actinoplanes sp. NBRC 103695 TaxID=3032202 RepID=UPI0024A160BD|nr:hypothetical protein [Actinoplanes sp. NBRC 103695]GLY93119.1 hypothetical protein Acsp02_03750 [Actinoplanes sp. NBRC 103695]